MKVFLKIIILTIVSGSGNQCESEKTSVPAALTALLLCVVHTPSWEL